MRYFGGKSRIAKQLAQFLSQYDTDFPYWEPFCGSCAVLIELVKLNSNRDYYASDKNIALITMWKALQEGYEFPTEITEDLYRHYKLISNPDDPLTAFIGIGCSFAGKWFNGYARSKEARNYALNMYNTLIKVKPLINNVNFNSKDFFDTNVRGMLIYCDPPYKDTTQPYFQTTFDTGKFWNKIRELSKENLIFISEYMAPEDFECVLEISTRLDVHTKSNATRIEKLWKYKG